jgi:poly(A) polymerase
MTRLNLLETPDVLRVFDVLHGHGGESRIVGGCVRDALLGIVLDRELDIATTLLPDQVEEILHAQGYKTFLIGKQFGTVATMINGRFCEITTLREDIETDGRRAVVRYTDDWKVDASRRDFTINAMSYSPRDGKLYDYFGGEEDLRRGCIRFVGNAERRVQEDYLRILRFFRFYTYFGKDTHIDEESLEACVKYAERLNTLSGERKQAELYKMLAHLDRMSTLALMQKSGVLSCLFEHVVRNSVVEEMERVEQLARACGYKFDTRLLLFMMAREGGEVSRAVSLFKLSSEDVRYLKNMQKSVAHLSSQKQDSLSDTERSDVELRESCYLGSQSTLLYEIAYKYGLDALIYRVAIDNGLSSGRTSLVKEFIENGVPRLPVNASDIMQAFNLEPGKEVGRLLHEAEEFWCKSRFKVSKGEVLEFLQLKI